MPTKNLKISLLRGDDQLSNVFCFFNKNLKAKLLLVWKFYSCLKKKEEKLYRILAFCTRISIEICLTRGSCFSPEKPVSNIQVLSTHWHLQFIGSKSHDSSIKTLIQTWNIFHTRPEITSFPNSIVSKQFSHALIKCILYTFLIQIFTFFPNKKDK